MITQLLKFAKIYLCVWLIVVASFWCGLRNDAMLFSGILYIVSIAFSIILGLKYAKLQRGKGREWIFIAVVSVINTAFTYLTFSLSNNLAFNKINMPDWDMFTMSLTFAFIGIMIGRTFPMKAKTREGRIETIIRFVAKILAVIYIITVASAYILPAETTGALGTSSIAGDYQAVEYDNGNDDDYIGGYWHLYIGQDEESGDWNLSIYDNEAGNPGVEGPVTDMQENSNKSGIITIEIDQDYYDELPSYKWITENDEFLTIEYKLTKNGIELTNNGTTIQFNREDSDEE